MTFKFKTRFWEELHKESISFLHSGPENYFPTWWTQVPVRSSYLIAWQGGPKAYELSEMTSEERLDAAFKTLQKLTGKSRAYLKNQCVASYSHDWNKDPFSLSAYSYTGVQDRDHVAALRKPVGRTVLFAGEATAQGTAQGTVHGALESGLRAAKQAIHLLA
jgi:monoamine oxidase